MPSELASAQLPGLFDSGAQLRLLVDAVTDYAIYMLDVHGDVVTWNTGAERLKGYAADEAIGRNVSLFFTPEDVAAGRPAAELARAAAQGRTEQEGWRVRKDGSRFWASVVLSAMRDEHRELIGFAKVTRDMSARREVDERLRTYAAKLEQSNRELESFASIASHDLQEPLRKIRAFGDLLVNERGAELGEQALGYVERMRGAAARMSQLIENLLSYSRVMTKAEPFVAVDLDRVLREVTGDLESRIDETRGRVETRGALPTIEGDPIQMRQLFQNLLGNALKFHRPGTPPILVVSGSVLPRSDDAPRRCELRFEDNGIGFEPRYAEQIFGVFQRLHGRAEYEGTGIGLAICRRIVDRHQGTITALGRPGEGATFVVVLPCEHRDEEKSPR